jgi:tight adherence protein B
MLTLIIIVATFVCVAALVGGVAIIFRGNRGSAIEDRLSMLTAGGGVGQKSNITTEGSLLAAAMSNGPTFMEELFSKVLNLRVFLEQAGSNVSPSKFLMISGGLAGAGTVVCLFSGLPYALAPLAGLILAALPFGWLFFKRKRRLANFGKQLPEALELIGRALRAGHSLASGFNLVATEMTEPIKGEFLRAYEEQNFGVPLDEALEGMTDRVPNLDLRFFATAVILQRQTGGDLAEILDKIGYLVRERFKIWGQVQALTGEGRLSGIVLLALPPVLFITMYRLNPDYIMTLFTDPLGHKMLAVAAVLQIVGALVIKKIINIKV